MNRLNILIITGIFPPDIGGPASYVPEIAAALVNRGHRLSVLTLSDRPGRDEWPFPVRRIRRSTFRLWRFLKTVACIVRQGRQADVLFVQGLALEAVTANYMLGRPLVQKVVGDLAWERARTFGRVRDSLEEFQSGKYGWSVELVKKLRSFWVSRSRLVITPSRYLKQVVQGWGIPADRVRVVYNALQADPEEAGGLLPPEPGPFGRGACLVSVGRLVPWKGFEDVIGLADFFPDIRVVLIGEGPERPGLERLIDRKGLQGRVRLTGQLSRKTVFSFLKQADVFVLNSAYEGLPHIVLEAMAAGAPVVATEVGGTGEVVRDGHNGLLVAPAAPEALRGAVKRLLENPGLGKRLAANGFKTLEQFQWPRLVEETESVLAEAAELPEDPRLRVLFVGSVRVGDPPDPTLIKKWSGLNPFFQSTVIAFRAGSGPCTAGPEGARWVLIPSGGGRAVRYGLHFFATFFLVFFGAARRRYDAVVAQSPYEGLAAALALLPWKAFGARSRPRLIVEVHSDWQEGVMLYHRSRVSPIEKRLRAAAGHLCLALADATRAISEYCRGLLPTGERKPVFIFPTFTDLSRFKEPEEEALREVSRNHGPRFFVYAGMLIYLKGVHHLIRAFGAAAHKDPDLRLVIAGKGEAEQELRALCKAEGLEGRVDFVGHVEQARLAAYIKKSLAFVLPSLTEGLGRVAIEAQLMGRPVVASRVGGLPEVVTDGQTGFLCAPGDEQALSRALLSILEDPERADCMGQAGRKAVLSKFDYSNYFQAYYDMVRKTCRR